MCCTQHAQENEIETQLQGIMDVSEGMKKERKRRKRVNRQYFLQAGREKVGSRIYKHIVSMNELV